MNLKKINKLNKELKQLPTITDKLNHWRTEYLDKYPSLKMRHEYFETKSKEELGSLYSDGFDGDLDLPMSGESNEVLVPSLDIRLNNLSIEEKIKYTAWLLLFKAEKYFLNERKPYIDNMFNEKLGKLTLDGILHSIKDIEKNAIELLKKGNINLENQKRITREQVYLWYLREDFSSIQLETRLFQFVVESISKHKYELPYLKECLKKDKENFVIKLNQKINFEHFNLIIKLFEREYFDEGDIEKLNHWFNTSAQTGTKLKIKKPMQFSGQGSDIRDKSIIIAKSKKKFITQRIVIELVKIARKKGDKEMEKTLWNTYRCLNKVLVADNKLYGFYCGNRVCTICMGNRKAKMINQYLPIIQNWTNPKLVTLTARSCYAKHLNSRMRAMKRAFNKILTKLKKRNQRGKVPKIEGIKSLECNFNPVTRTYNPHYHIIVPNWEIAILLKREWMKLWTKKFTNGWAQDIRPVKNNVEALIEVVKYGSKIFTQPDPNNKNKKKISPYVYTSALYNILSSMRGIRLFDRFGFSMPKGVNEQIANSTTFFEYEELSYHSDIMDWVNEETGEPFSGYKPDRKLTYLLNHRIETTLE